MASQTKLLLSPATFTSQPSVRESDAAAAPKKGVAVPQAGVLPRFTTKVWVFLTHTGDDAGSTSEIRSKIHFANGNEVSNFFEASNNHEFSAEHGGLGLLLLFRESAARRGVAWGFEASAFEEGNLTTGDRYFIDGKIDFDSGPDEWMSGDLFTWGPWTNSSDPNFKGYI
jgi:hypothetical protein